MRLAPLALLVVSATAAAAPPVWSRTQEGLHGRLIVESTVDDNKKPQISITVEIENVSDTAGGIPLAWTDIGAMVTFTVEDANGKVIDGMAPGGNHISPAPYFVNLPERSSIRAVVTSAALEYVPGGKTMFRPVAFQAWDYPTKHGQLYLRAKITPALEAGKKAPARHWSLPIETTRVALP